MGRFEKGNKAAVGHGGHKMDRQRFQAIAASLLEEVGVEAFTQILRKGSATARVRALQLLLEYAVGKPLTVAVMGHVHDRIDPNSPEGILLKLAGQPIPGAGLIEAETHLLETTVGEIDDESDSEALILEEIEREEAEALDLEEEEVVRAGARSPKRRRERR